MKILLVINMRAVIIGAGAVLSYSFYKKLDFSNDFIICADGGYDHCEKMGLSPNLILGDFDSVKLDLPISVETLTFPKEKDETDAFIATRIAVERGFKSIIYLGCLGNRLDHTLSNITMLKFCVDRGVFAEIIDENNCAFLINKNCHISGKAGDTISLLPMFGDAFGISSKGLYYPLNNESLESGTSRGISNVFMGDTAHIDIERGYLLCIISRD